MADDPVTRTFLTDKRIQLPQKTEDKHKKADEKVVLEKISLGSAPFVQAQLVTRWGKVYEAEIGSEFTVRQLREAVALTAALTDQRDVSKLRIATAAGLLDDDKKVSESGKAGEISLKIMERDR